MNLIQLIDVMHNASDGPIRQKSESDESIGCTTEAGKSVSD